MNFSIYTCHRCNNKGYTGLMNSNSNCFTCNGIGHLTIEHAILFELGFEEEVNLANVYKMYLQKVLNELETINVWVKRQDDKFQICKLVINGPNSQDYTTRIQNVGDLINLLKQ